MLVSNIQAAPVNTANVHAILLLAHQRLKTKEETYNQNLYKNGKLCLQSWLRSSIELTTSLFTLQFEQKIQVYDVFSVPLAAFSSCNFFTEAGGLTTMLLFHSLSSFLDSLLPIPCSISLSLFTVTAVQSEDFKLANCMFSRYYTRRGKRSKVLIKTMN